MKMQVVNLLATLNTRVNHQAKATFVTRITTVFKRNLGEQCHHSTQPAGIRLAYLLQRRDVVTRDHQQMDRCGRSNIMKNQTILILMNNFGRDSTLSNLAK
jgi:hypothetical protein